MMRTDQALYGAFALLEGQADAYGAPAIDAKPRSAHGRSVRQMRPVLAVCGAVATVLAAVAGVALVLAPHRHATPPTAPPAVPLRIGVTVLGYPTVAAAITAEYQDVTISRPRFYAGTVRVYAPGAFNPNKIPHNTPVSINGHRGYSYTGQLDFGASASVHGLMVAWPYAPDAWAVVTPVGSSRTQAGRLGDELRVARATRVGGSTQLKVPFRLGYLPPGLVPTSGSFDSRRPTKQGAIGFNDGKLIVTVNPGGLGGRVPLCNGDHPVQTTVNGLHGCLGYDELSIPDGSPQGRRLQLQIPGGWLTVQVPESRVYPDITLKRIAAAVTLATLDRLDTWFDADTAVPH